MGAEVVINADNVGFRYDDSVILNGVSVEIKRGDHIGIIGPNGAGKTTLLNLLNRYLKPSSGTISLLGRLLSSYSQTEIAREIATVPQAVSIIFSYTVIELVLMARHPYLGTFSFESAQDHQIAIDSLKLVDAEQFADRYFAQLSGGEKQRVIIARAIAQQTDILLLDEPTSSLDLKHQLSIQKILTTMNKERGTTIVMVSHDINLASMFCSKIILMNEGRIVKSGTPSEVITEQTMRDVYGIDLTIELSDNHKPFFRFKD